jgi:hypothetical protein
MSNNELIKCVEDAITLLENYRSFGPMVEEGISAFKKINKCIQEPTPEAVTEAKTIIAEMQRQIGPYKSMVPQVSLALDKLNEWSKDN